MLVRILGAGAAIALLLAALLWQQRGAARAESVAGPASRVESAGVTRAIEPVSAGDGARVPSARVEATPEPPSNPRAEPRRWRDLVLPVDATTGRAVPSPSVILRSPSGRRHVVELDASIAAWQLAEGTLAALDGPQHVARPFWVTAVDLDADAPARVRLGRGARVVVEGTHGLDGLQLSLEAAAQDQSFPVESGAALGLDALEAERVLPGAAELLGMAVLSTESIDDWATVGAAGLAPLEPLLVDLEAQMPALAWSPGAMFWGGWDAPEDPPQTVVFDELTPDLPLQLALDTPWGGAGRVRAGFPELGVWTEWEPLPVTPRAGETVTVRVEELPTATVLGRLAPPVSSGTVKIWELRPRDPTAPEGDTVNVLAERVDVGPDGLFRVEDVRAGPVEVDAEWTGGEPNLAKHRRSLGLEPGEIRDLGTLERSAGSRVRFEPRVLVDGRLEPLRLQGCHFEVILFPPRESGAEQIQTARRSAEPFALEGIPVGRYRAHVSKLSLEWLEDSEGSEHSGGSLRCVRTLWNGTDSTGGPQTLEVTGDTTVTLDFELVTCTELRLSVPSPAFTPSAAAGRLALRACGWNRATREVVASGSVGYVPELPWARSFEPTLALTPGRWTWCVVLVPDVLNIDDLPTPGTYESWCASGEVRVGGAGDGSEARVDVALRPAAVVHEPTPAEGTADRSSARHAAFHPTGWPKETQSLWSAWDVGQGAHVYGALPGTEYVGAGSAATAPFVTPPAGEVATVER
ncbi:MAG: hypothetical protein AAFR54_08600 [Planctomycetota bacterium]